MPGERATRRWEADAVCSSTLFSVSTHERRFDTCHVNAECTVGKHRLCAHSSVVVFNVSNREKHFDICPVNAHRAAGSRRHVLISAS